MRRKAEVENGETMNDERVEAIAPLDSDRLGWPVLGATPRLPAEGISRGNATLMTGSSIFWARFILAALAVWRVTHLLASEDGPWDLIARMRSTLGNSVFGRLMDCFGCLSIWVSIPFAFVVSRRIKDDLLIWLALSGSAFLLERATAEQLIIEKSVEAPKGDSDHVLR